MLTKDLTKFAIRKDRLVPFRLSDTDQETAQDLARIHTLFQNAVGQTEIELKQNLDPLPTGKRGVILGGLFKLFNDRVEYETPSEDIKTRRWDLFLQAQELRESQTFDDEQSFREALEEQLDCDVDEAGAQLYADLPSQKKVASVPNISLDELRARYNCAQVQSALLKSSELTLDLSNATVSEARYIARQLSFHRLMAEPIDESGKRIKLSGPLTVLDKAQNYGDRLARFFPHVLTLGKFKLEGVVTHKRKNFLIKVDARSKLQSYISPTSPYIPEEFEKVFSGLKQKHKNWNIEMSGRFISLGQGDFLQPDIAVKIPDQDEIHIELWHRWHKNKLTHKIEKLEKAGLKDVRLGVSRDLAKKKDLKDFLDGSSWFQEYGFVFSDFPTTNQLIKAIGG